MSKRRQKPIAIDDEVRELYWSIDIPTSEIMEAYRIPTTRQLATMAGPTRSEYTCRICSGPLLAYSRQQLRRINSRNNTCAHCLSVIYDNRNKEYQAERRAAIARHLDRVSKLRSLSYTDYLRTDHWVKVRESAIRRAKWRCQACYSSRDIQVHHRTYDRLGEESPSDLMVLCDPCHSVFHSERRLSR